MIQNAFLFKYSFNKNGRGKKQTCENRNEEK